MTTTMETPYGYQSTVEARDAQSDSTVYIKLACGDRRNPRSMIEANVVQAGKPSRSLQFYGTRNLLTSLPIALHNSGITIDSKDLHAELAHMFLYEIG